MKIRYVGPNRSVEIAATGQVAEKGKTIEVDDALAKSLLKQDVWEKVADKKEKE